MHSVILDTLKETTVVGNESDASIKHDPFVEKLLLVLGEEAFSTSELMEKLGLSHRPTFRKNYLLPAMKQGLVEMTIPDKPNSRNQKYRKK